MRARVNQVLFLLVLAALRWSAATAGSRVASKPPDDALSQLQRTQQQWLDALIRGDRTTVSRILAPEFAFTGRSGRVRLRDEEIAGVRPPADSSNRILDLYVDDQTVRVFGDAGVINGRVVEIGLRNGQDYMLVSRYTDTYTKRAGRWQVVASQLTRLEPVVRPVVRDSAVLLGDAKNVEGVAFSRDGRFLASASNGGHVRLWGFPAREQIRDLLGVNFTEVAFVGDDTVVAAGFDSSVRVWRRTTGEPLRMIRYPGPCEAVAISPDGKWLAAGGGDHAVHVWEMATGSERTTLRGHRDDVYTARFSPDGARIISAGRDRTVRIWDVASGRELRALRGPSDSVYGLAISEDGQLLSTACRDGTIILWNTTSWTPRYTLKGHKDSVHGVAFRPDGALMASASFDRSIRLWDTATGVPVAVLGGPTKKVSEVAFSPDGKWLAAASSDGTVRLWKVE